MAIQGPGFPIVYHIERDAWFMYEDIEDGAGLRWPIPPIHGLLNFLQAGSYYDKTRGVHYAPLGALRMLKAFIAQEVSNG
jgi:hypothetical protein